MTIDEELAKKADTITLLDTHGKPLSITEILPTLSWYKKYKLKRAMDKVRFEDD